MTGEWGLSAKSTLPVRLTSRRSNGSRAAALGQGSRQRTADSGGVRHDSPAVAAPTSERLPDARSRRSVDKPAQYSARSESLPPAYQAGGDATTTHGRGRPMGPSGPSRAGGSATGRQARLGRPRLPRRPRRIASFPAYNQNNRNSLAILRGGQTYLNSRVKPQSEKYLRSVSVAADTLDVACDAPACLLRQSACASTHRPGQFRVKDWLDWC